MDNNDKQSIIEATIFASGVPIARKDIVDKISFIDAKDFDKCIKNLKEKYDKENSGVILMNLNGKYQFVSNAKYGDQVAEVLTPLKEKALSKSLLECLAIIAYKQPVTRLDVEDIRGVSSEYAISMLVKFELIDVVGRKDVVGRPLLYATTDNFLRKFQIEDLSELPDYNEVLEHIALLDEQYPRNNGSDLFVKKEVADNDELDKKIEEELHKSNNEVASDVVEENVEKTEIDEFMDEFDDEIPEHLKGEKFEIIG